MEHWRTCALLIASINGAVAMAQVQDSGRSEVGRVYTRASGASRAVFPESEVIAGLPWDGSSTWGMRGQDFESAFDQYDIFLIEDIAPATDATLGEFRSVGFATTNPFGASDVVVRIFEDNGSGLPGQDTYTGSLLLQSVSGEGFYEGDQWITNFGGQCLPAGDYFLVWHAEMDFQCCGGSFFFIQAGEPIGGGMADYAWQWNPGRAFFGDETHERVVDPNSLEPTGVNYLLFGEPSNCGGNCSNPDCPADLDLDGDADSDDFFLYLDRFAGGDPCADIDGDADSDSDDFFAYLDLFAQGC